LNNPALFFNNSKSFSMETPWSNTPKDDAFDYSSNTPANPQTQYAGFWLRVVAALVDGIILSIFTAIVISPILRLLGYDFSFEFSMLDDPENLEIAISELLDNMMFSVAINYLVGWLYYAYMESSEKQATFGKLALGIKVTDTSFQRIDFAKASMRYFSKILSGIIMGIGYLMAAFTEKKQGLHDLIAGTLVVKKETETSGFEPV